jgi:hypothetical protein
MKWFNNMEYLNTDNWRKKSLEELENKNWGHVSEAPTRLVERCIELSKLPLDRFELNDLRIMIGQQFGLHYLILIAIEKLEPDLFIEAEYYEGDLLAAVLDVDSSFWKNHQHCWKQVYQLIKDKRQQLEEKKIATKKFDYSKS